MNRITRVSILLVTLTLGSRLGGMDFSRGDVNSDGGVNIADPIFLLSYMFANGPAPSCMDAADVNDDGTINISDAVFGLSFLKPGPGGFTLPPPPYQFCGVDPTADNLDCANFPPCP